MTSDKHVVPRIELSGDSFQIGLDHGRLLHTQIHRQLGIYREMFLSSSKLEWPQVLKIAETYHDTLVKLCPKLLEEMRGIAQGAELDVLDIIAMNSRSEIALGMWDDGCTSLASKTADRQTLAQNWDWRPSVGENLAIVSIAEKGMPKLWMVIEPGIVGKIGFNDKSVGLCFNAIRARPTDTSLLPIHVILRLCLQCNSASAAAEMTRQLGGSSSTQFVLIADAKESIGMELSPRGSNFLPPDDKGRQVHTNHLLKPIQDVTEPPWLDDSPIRFQRATALLDTCANADPGDLRKTVFTDESNGAQSICRLATGGKWGATQTLFNIVMTFQERQPLKAEVVFGRPGSGKESQVHHLP